MNNSRPRGAVASPRHHLAAATPHQIRGTTPAQFATIPSQLSFWLNDIVGDCVTAEEAFAKACYSPEIFIQDSTVQAWAQKHGVLNGAVISDVLQWMVSDGFQQGGSVYNDGAAASVDWTDSAALTNAIAYGPVKIGVAATQLENVVPDPVKNGWFATGFTKDDNIDHCVSLCGYGPMAWLAQQLGVSVPSGVDGTQPGYMMFTWDSIGVIDMPSLLAITAEAWLRTPTTVIVGPNPGPQPNPDIVHQIDAIFAALIAQAKRPAIKRALQLAQHLVDTYLAAHPPKPGQTVQQVVDAAFAALEASIHQPAILMALQIAQHLVDQWLAKHPSGR